MQTIPTALYQLLTTQGAIAFHQFMQLALYAPEYGYYQSNQAKFGKQGDFVTAPELTSLFGKTVALQCQSILAQLTSPCVLEFGAGTGRLCVDILQQLATTDCLPKTYYILEVSAFLRQQQKKLFAQEIPEYLPHIEWLDSWPTTPFSGVIIANEVLDAMPVHRFLRTSDNILESMIFWDNNQNACVEKFSASQDPALIDYVSTHIPAHFAPYYSEVNLFIPGWFQACYQALQQGVILCFDYGFPRHEYYLPERNQGTIMCHYQHRTHPNPLIHIGEQDITAHVDFTHVAEAAHQAGFTVAGYTNQASFLVNVGILSLLEKISQSAQQHTNNLQAVKKLLQPHEMGELFKVIALSKNFKDALIGFQAFDKTHTL